MLLRRRLECWPKCLLSVGRSVRLLCTLVMFDRDVDRLNLLSRPMEGQREGEVAKDLNLQREGDSRGQLHSHSEYVSDCTDMPGVLSRV